MSARAQPEIETRAPRTARERSRLVATILRAAYKRHVRDLVTRRALRYCLR